MRVLNLHCLAGVTRMLSLHCLSLPTRILMFPLFCLCSEDAESSHILQAVLEAAHLRALIRSRIEDKMSVSPRHRSGSNNSSSTTSGGDHTSSKPSNSPRDMTKTSSGTVPAPVRHLPLLWEAAGPLLKPEELGSCACEAKRAAQRDLSRFLEDLQGQGWKTKTVLLSTTEKVRYVKLRE